MKPHRLHTVPVLAGTAVFCMAAALWIDRPLALFLRGHETETVMEAFRIVTSLGTVQYLVPVMLAAGFGVYLYFRMYARRRNSFYSLSLLHVSVWIILSEIMSSAIVHAMKIAIGRFRPRFLFEEGLYGFSAFGGGDSFPSGHTQVIVAALVPLMIFWPRLWLPGILVITAVGASRLVLGAHYLGDVVASVVITVLCVLWLQKRLAHRVKWRQLVMMDR